MQDAWVDPARNYTSFGYSRGGALLYPRGAIGEEPFEFVWVTRSGEITPLDSGETFNFLKSFQLSPNDDRIAVPRFVDSDREIWVKELP